jgi:hypothetical protein
MFSIPSGSSGRVDRSRSTFLCDRAGSIGDCIVMLTGVCLMEASFGGWVSSNLQVSWGGRELPHVATVSLPSKLPGLVAPHLAPAVGGFFGFGLLNVM